MQDMIDRCMEKSLAASARVYPILTVTGPRQSGKTTLVRKVFPNYDYVSLENPDDRAFALDDPRGFLNRFQGSVILDEIQRVPDLFSYLQGRADEADRPGRYVLTGSQNFLLLERVSQSLAGRTALFRLLPFSRAELAGRTGQILNLSSLGVDCGISHATARRWLSVLEASFIVHLLQTHFKNFSKRLIKSPKLYFIDTGLLCYLLRIQSANELITHASRGAVFETFVLAELLKASLNQGTDPEVYFWRDVGGHEVDFVLGQGRNLMPIEAKSGETIAGDYLKGIEYWRGLPGQKKASAAVVYGGETSIMRSQTAFYSWKDWL